MQIGAVMAKMRRPYEILVIDDGSSDGTAAKAREAGARVISHPYNIGNGAAVKTGIREARGRVIVMMDADGQHDPADIPRLLEDRAVRHGRGARTRESDTSTAIWPIGTTGSPLSIADRGPDVRLPGERPIRHELSPAAEHVLPYPTTLTLAIVRSGSEYVPSKRRGGSAAARSAFGTASGFS
jgi:glycosyltransferase involved in cell wall biosynthesis